MTDHLLSIKTLCLGKRSHLTNGKKCSGLDGAYPKWQRGLLDFKDLFNGDPQKCVVCVMKTGNLFYFFIKALNPPAFLKLLSYRILPVSHICPLRQEVNVRKLAGSISQARGRSFCLGTIMVLGILEPQAPLTSSSLLGIQDLDFPIPNPEDLRHGKKKAWPRSPWILGPYLRDEEEAGRSKPLSHQVITGEGNEQA